MASIRPLAFALTGGALLWTAAIVAAPHAMGSERFGTPAAIIYATSSRICHQRAERSFRSAGVQWPVCARCAGLYLSGAAGALLGWIGLTRWSPSRSRGILALAAVPTAVTWTLEVTGVTPFSNIARAFAALPLGAAAGWLFITLLRYDSGLDARQVHRSRTPPLTG